MRKFNALILEQGEELKQQAERIQETNAELTAANKELDANNERLREANIRLEAANERLSVLNREKDEFFGIVAHDLKNLLTGIFCRLPLCKPAARSEVKSVLRRLPIE